MAVHISVHGGNGEKAIRDLKRKMQRELVFRQMKMSRFYEPPSAKKVREGQEADRRIKVINGIIKDYNIESILDLGCGDLYWAEKLDLDKTKI